MPERREFRPRKRRSGFRDAKLIVIATEGAITEKVYFEDLASSTYYHNPRVHVEVPATEGSASSPEHVLKRMHAFRREYRLNVHDELWLVIDRDRG